MLESKKASQLLKSFVKVSYYQKLILLTKVGATSKQNSSKFEHIIKYLSLKNFKVSPTDWH